MVAGVQNFLCFYVENIRCIQKRVSRKIFPCFSKVFHIWKNEFDPGLVASADTIFLRSKLSDEEWRKTLGRLEVRELSHKIPQNSYSIEHV